MKQLLILSALLVLLAVPQKAFAVDYRQGDTISATNSSHSASPPFKNNLKPTANNLMMEKEKTATGAMRTKMQEFKAQIGQIKDVKKRNIVERIGNNLSSTNTKLTGKMNNALSRMSSILSKIKQKSATLKTAGKNTAALDSAITAAETTITKAQTIVTAQTQKTYVTTITDTTILPTAIGQLITQFRQDINVAFQAVTDAKTAVTKAMIEAAKISSEPTATDSAVLREGTQL